MDPKITAALNAIESSAAASLTAPGYTDEDALPPVKFPRLSVERRVLGHITDETDGSPLGARNTLAALTEALMRDPNTTRPRGGMAEALPIDRPLEDTATHILAMLTALTDAGLVEQREDGSYQVTDAGHVELAS